MYIKKGRMIFNEEDLESDIRALRREIVIFLKMMKDFQNTIMI